MASLRYQIEEGEGELILAEDVLAHIEKYRQSDALSNEAGGQLFAEFHEPDVHLLVATGPRRTDSRLRRWFVPDRLAERAEIRRMFRAGLHYVGDWHTHPVAVPTPSPTDEASIHETFNESVHQLAGFVLLILGTDPAPTGLFVGVTNGTEFRQLRPV